MSNVVKFAPRKKAAEATPPVPRPVRGESAEYRLHSVFLAASAAALREERAVCEELLEHARICCYADWVEIPFELHPHLDDADLTPAMFGPEED